MSAGAARWGSLATVLLGLLAASGCGGSSSSSSTTTPASLAAAQAAARTQSINRSSIAVESSARASNGVVAPQYTCKGANVSVPATWAGVRPGAKEIVILVRSIVRAGNGTVNWAVAGINPSVQSIAAGKLPAGAVVGRNSFGQDGYSLCPKGAALVTVDVFAFAHTLGLKQGFDPAPLAAEAASPSVQWGSLLLYSVPVASPATTG